jgi:hypothetical protein
MQVVNEAVALAEDVTSSHFKYSSSQWRRSRYDIRTIGQLQGQEITDRAFAQIIRYMGQPPSSHLSSSRFDFYKVCLQDHTILQALSRDPRLDFFPLMVYIVTHELVHIVRFSRFIQSFEAYPEDRVQEEARVHSLTGAILDTARVSGIEAIVRAYRESPDSLGIPLDQMAKGA